MDALLSLVTRLRAFCRYGYLRSRYSGAKTEAAAEAMRSTAEYVQKHLSHLQPVGSPLELLTAAFKEAHSQNSLICEFGVYSGLTINHIASLTARPVYGFDSFEGLPERWRDGFEKRLFERSSLPWVRSNVVIIKGWFNETLPQFLEQHREPCGFLHIDCDLYSSTRTVLEACSDRIQPGCIIVFDEYFNYPGWEEGEFKAFQEFLQATGLNYDYIGCNKVGEQAAVRIR